MGGNKLALSFGATTIGNSALQSALDSTLDHIIVVAREGDTFKWIDSALFQTPLMKKWTPVTCQDADKGQAHSLRCGLLAAMEMKPKGIMVLLADQPFLSEGIINDLVLRYVKARQENKNILFVAARFQGIPRPPIIFSPEAVPELLSLKGDEGARRLLQKQELQGLLVDYENVWNFLDIDTREEYEGLKGVGISHD